MISLISRLFSALVLLSCIACPSGSLNAQARKPSADAPAYQLSYKLSPGEQLVSKVVHFAETRTKMSEHEEASSSRTITEKVWEVIDVNDKGQMTFEYRINSVQLAQTVGEAEELSYDSTAGNEVPDMFKQVAETVNKPLARVTINSQGQILNRDSELKSVQLGMGELTLPLPAEPIAVGAQWSVPRDARVKLESGVHKTVKVRELYTLEKVASGVATISIRTQPISSVTDPAVESQLIQQLSEGEIKFDIDRGRMLHKQLDWSKEVVGFRGPESSLRYDAKFTEELLPSPSRTASRR